MTELTGVFWTRRTCDKDDLARRSFVYL